MWSGLGGALLGVGSSLLGMPLQNYYNKKAQSQSNDYSIHMWNLANEYNLPKNQMKRLKDAGLNPNLAYGNMSTVSPAGSTPRQAPDAQGAMGKVGDSLMNYYTIQQMKKSNDKLDAEIAAIRAAIDNQEVRTANDMLELPVKMRRNDVIRKTGIDPNDSGPVGWISAGASAIADQYHKLERGTFNLLERSFGKRGGYREPKY